MIVHFHTRWIHYPSIIHSHCLLALGADHARVAHWTKRLRLFSAASHVTWWVSVFGVYGAGSITWVVSVSLRSLSEALVASTLRIVLSISHLLTRFEERSSLHSSWIPTAKGSLASSIRGWPVQIVAISTLLPNVTSFRCQDPLIQSLHPRVSIGPTVWTLGTNPSLTPSCPRFTRRFVISATLCSLINFIIGILFILH